jgi:hypothetical protein
MYQLVEAAVSAVIERIGRERINAKTKRIFSRGDMKSPPYQSHK